MVNFFGKNKSSDELSNFDDTNKRKMGSGKEIELYKELGETFLDEHISKGWVIFDLNIGILNPDTLSMKHIDGRTKEINIDSKKLVNLGFKLTDNYDDYFRHEGSDLILQSNNIDFEYSPPRGTYQYCKFKLNLSKFYKLNEIEYEKEINTNRNIESILTINTDIPGEDIMLEKATQELIDTYDKISKKFGLDVYGKVKGTGGLIKHVFKEKSEYEAKELYDRLTANEKVITEDINN